MKQKSTARDLLEQQTEVALLRSMSQSKTLTFMVIAGCIGFGGFFWLLSTL